MPLQFDMPFDQLKSYQGSNPRPADFDDFWDNSLAELAQIDPNPELVSADFQTSFAECFDLYYTSMGGARIHAKLLRPRNAAKSKQHPAVLMFHGYSGSAGDWSDKLGYAAEGYTVAAMDCSEKGGKSPDNGGVYGWNLRGQI